MDLRALVLLSILSTAVAQQDVVLTMTSGEQCFGSRVTLLCTHPDPLADAVKYIPQDITWDVDGTTIDFTDQSGKRFTPTRLNSTASTLSFTVTEEDHRDRVITCTCFLVLNNANRDREESNVVTMNPPKQPLPPIITAVPTNSSYVLSWTHNTTCFTHHTFTYNISWTRTPSGPSSSGHSTTNETEYTLSGLPPGEYSVSVQAVCNENSSVVSGVGSTQINIKSSTEITDTNVGGSGNTLNIIIIVVVVVVVVLIIVIVMAVVTICLCRNESKVTQTDVEGKVPAPNPPKKDLYGQVEYAEVYISNDRPCRAPRIPDVEYTEAMGPGQKVKTPPPDSLPPKKGVKRCIKPDPFKSNELKMKVVAILQQKKIVHGSLDPDEPVVGTFQNKTFVANFVYFEDTRWDVPEREIDEMVKMRDHQGTDKGLLVTNMETLPSNLLEKLEEQHCHFIGVGKIEQLTDNALMKKFGLFFTSEK